MPGKKNIKKLFDTSQGKFFEYSKKFTLEKRSRVIF
jgi:hypothetical protein